MGNTVTGNGLALVSQAEFARLKGVSRKTITQWKREQRLVFAGKLIDVAASQAGLLRQSSHASAGKRAPVTQAADRVTGNAPGNAARYVGGATYDSPANLPDEVSNASSAINGGAWEMATLLRPHMPLTLVKALVLAWVKAMRAGWVGGPGLPDSVADVDWPPPPIGFNRWSDHPMFQLPALSETDWEEIEADHAAGKLEKVG